MTLNLTLLQGEDSVTAADETASAFFCFYSAGTFANGTATKARFPGKLYMGITPSIKFIPGADTLDVETGDAVNADAATFVEMAKPPNLNLPGLYTSLDNVPALQAALTARGIGRNRYYLFQADWDDKDSIPAGVDIAQWANTTAYDKDVAYAYVFKAYAPPPPPVVVKGTQDGWRWCRKCGSLFWPGKPDVCAAGSVHDGSTSYDYSLPYERST